jgi:hypothetical protein
MLVRQSRKELEWCQRLARFAASAKQIKPFCQAELVSEAALYRWRTKLAGTVDATPAAGFIDVGVMAATPEAQSMRQLASVGVALAVRLDLGHGMKNDGRARRVCRPLINQPMGDPVLAAHREDGPQTQAPGRGQLAHG